MAWLINEVSGLLSSAIAVLASIALLMPGFIVAELALARSARGPRSDLELALRALASALVIHLGFSWWTASLIRRLGWTEAWGRAAISGLSMEVVQFRVALAWFWRAVVGFSEICDDSRFEPVDGRRPDPELATLS